MTWEPDGKSTFFFSSTAYLLVCVVTSTTKYYRLWRKTTKKHKTKSIIVSMLYKKMYRFSCKITILIDNWQHSILPRFD